MAGNESFLPVYDHDEMFVNRNGNVAHHDHVDYRHDHEDDEDEDEEDYFNSQEVSSSTGSSPRSTTPGPADDSSIRVDPDRHVDYLSHEWAENDIWSSWRHVTKQKAFLQSGARLENASWRTWAKARNNLKTISPETLNWLKDCDVTWLYGPLHRGSAFANAERPFAGENGEEDARAGETGPDGLPRRGSSEWPQSKPRLTSASSFHDSRQSKPILKKRSNSEMVLARNSSSTRLAIQAPRADAPTQAASPASTGTPTSASAIRPSALRTHSANSALLLNKDSGLKQHFRNNTGELGRRRIHFNESVEQCISIIKPVPGDDDYDSQHPSDDDDAPTMRISVPKTPVNIAKLPSTTLKMPSVPVPVPGADYGRHHYGAGGGVVSSAHAGYNSGSAAHEDYSRRSDPYSSSGNSSSNHGGQTYGGSGGVSSTRSSRSNSADSTILPNYDGAPASPPSLLNRAADVVTSARELVSVIWSASGWRSTSNSSQQSNTSPLGTSPDT